MSLYVFDVIWICPKCNPTIIYYTFARFSNVSEGPKRDQNRSIFPYVAPQFSRRRPKGPRKTVHVSPMGAPCAPQKSPWGAHGPQTGAFGVTQGPPLVVFGPPPKPIWLISKVWEAQKIGENSVHVLCCFFLQIRPQSTQQD